MLRAAICQGDMGTYFPIGVGDARDGMRCQHHLHVKLKQNIPGFLAPLISRPAGLVRSRNLYQILLVARIQGLH